MVNLVRQIEEKQNVINELMKTDYRSSYDKIVLLSQELDKLIVRQMKISLMKKAEKT
jgi:hypothetical protein